MSLALLSTLYRIRITLVTILLCCSLGLVVTRHPAVSAAAMPAIIIGYVDAQAALQQSPAVQAATQLLQEHVAKLQAEEQAVADQPCGAKHDLTQMQQRDQQDIDARRNALLTPILTRLHQVEDDVRGRDGLTCVVEVGPGGRVSGGRDVTSEVVRGMK